jgi:hypothetical protein
MFRPDNSKNFLVDAIETEYVPIGKRIRSNTLSPLLPARL